MRTREKSYIPRARSNNLSASLRKIMYLTASSALAESCAIDRTTLAVVLAERREGTDL